jgi:hypothetical protein
MVKDTCLIALGGGGGISGSLKFWSSNPLNNGSGIEIPNARQTSINQQNATNIIYMTNLKRIE